MCVTTMALVFDRNPEFLVDPRFSSFGLKRKRKRGRPKNIGGALDRRVPRAADQGEADQGEEIEEGELLRGEVGPNIAPMEEEIGGDEGGYGVVVITFSKADAERLRLIKRELRLTSDYYKSD